MSAATRKRSLNNDPMARRRRRNPRIPNFAQIVNSLNPDMWLELSEASGSILPNRGYTEYSPDQPGPELLTNRIAPFAFTADNPDGWTVTNETPNDYVVGEVGAGEGHTEWLGSPGSGYINYYSLTASPVMNLRQDNVLTLGDTYRSIVEINTHIAGQVKVVHPLFDLEVPGSAGTHVLDGISQDDNDFTFQSLPSAVPVDITFESMSCRKIGQLDASATNLTLAQTGLLGAGHAVDFNGSTSVATVRRSTINGLTTAYYGLLIKPDTLTANDRLLWLNGELDIYVDGSGFIVGARTRGTTNAESTSSVALTTGAWQWVEVIYQSDVISYRINGADASDATPTTGAGTTASTSNALQIGKDGGTGAYDGLLDEVVMDINSVPTAAQSMALARSLGLAA